MPERPVGAVDFGEDYIRRLVSAGRAFRAVVLWLGVVYLAGIASIVLVGLVAGAGPEPGEAVYAVIGILFGIVRPLVQMAAEIMMLVNVWRLASALGRSPGLWLLLMFFPLINILGLLRLSAIAQEHMARADVKVGLLGPSLRDLDALAESVRTAPPRSPRP